MSLQWYLCQTAPSASSLLTNICQFPKPFLKSFLNTSLRIISQIGVVRFLGNLEFSFFIIHPVLIVILPKLYVLPQIGIVSRRNNSKQSIKSVISEPCPNNQQMYCHPLYTIVITRDILYWINKPIFCSHRSGP